jgi:hypothetical protein
MVFINWWTAGLTAIALLMIAAGAVGLRKAGGLRDRAARIGIRTVSFPAAALGALLGLLLLLTWASGCETFSAPIYSPSGRAAVRIYDIDGGATDGDTGVEVRWAKGFRQAGVFSGPWKSVEPADVRWIGNSELRIAYRALTGYKYSCRSTSAVKVLCTPK